MRSILKSILGLFISVFKDKKPVKVKTQKIKTDVPPGYRPLYFYCWLCNGRNKFACKTSIGDRKFRIECSWCGVENLVTVASLNKEGNK